MRIHRQDITYGIALVTVALALIFLWPGLLKNLFVANGFMPHGHCYLWQPALVWLHFTSDLSIGLAYVAISATLAYLVYKSRQDIPFHWMFLLFGSFIVACSSTHFMELWTLWTPTYWLAGELKLITAVASVTTAVVLPSLVPQIIVLVETAKISQERKQKLEIANQELEALTCRLKELDQLKSQFFTNVSHELRTPLTLIIGPLEKLLADDRLTSEQRYPLEVMRRNAGTLSDRVNDLLDVSKLEAGKMKANYAEVDLAQLVRFSAGHFETLAQELQILFSIEIPQSAIAQVDPQKLQRICFNLLSNAFKFTPNHGNIKCILVSQAEVTEQDNDNNFSRSNGTFTLTVEDSGPGVAPEFRKIIFEPFRQGEQLPNRFGSTGLGLAIVKEFVELHNGNITVTDSSLGGAKFTIELPSLAPAGVSLNSQLVELPDKIYSELRTRSTAELSDALPPSPTPRSDAPVVLVVEDNVEMNRFITDILNSDYCVISALDGKEGLEKAIALRPDLILSDVMMPNMSGDLMVKEVRSRSELDRIPIVLLTAKADDELRVQLLRNGVQDYLMKPFFMEELKVRVKNQIATKRATEILQQELASQSQDLTVLAKEAQTSLAALQESEQRFHQLAEHIDRVFWMFDSRNCQILYISPAYEKIWGFTCQSLYEKPRAFLDSIHPSDMERVVANLAKQNCGEYTEVEYRINHPDGSMRWIFDRAFPIHDESGQVYRICGIAEDITQRKQTEAALQKLASQLEILVYQRTAELAQTNAKLQEERESLRVSEQRFRSYFELPLIGIAITSIDKTWLQINDKLCEILGYSRQELKLLTWADITYPDDLPKDVAKFNRVLARELETYSLDKRFIRKNGEVIHATIATQCVRHPDGSIDYFLALVQDITERVKAIEKLRLLESVVVNARDAVVITEAEPIEEPGPRIIYVNDAFSRMTGYAPEEVVGKTPRILQGPNSDRNTTIKLREALQKWQSLEVELINYRQDRSQYWVELSIVPVADEKGWYTHWIAIERDITERKQSEEALYRRQQEFKTLVENSPDLIMRCDRQMRYLYVNPEVERVSGMPAKNYIGKNFRELGSPEQICQLWESSLNKVFETNNQQTIEFETDTAQGWRSYQSRIVPEFSQEGNVESALIVIRDLTELKQAEEERTQLIREQAARALAETQQKRFAFLAEASMILASSLNYETTLWRVARLVVPYLADCCMVYLAQDDGTLSGLAVAHLHSTKEKLLLQLQPLSSFDRNNSHPVLEVFRRGLPAFYLKFTDSSIEPTAVNSQYSQLLEILQPLSLLVLPLVIQGRRLGVLSLAFAESDRRYQTEEINLAEELATRISLAVDNAKTHREAQDANRLKDEFLAVLSHELRTPLNAILGWSTLLRTRNIDAATTARALETIERNARAQTQMVSDLLDVSRIIRGKLQLNLSPLDLIPILMTAVDTVQPTADTKGIELNCFLDPVGRVAGDSDRLQQVIWNLLSNAIKFTASGGSVEVRLAVFIDREVTETGQNRSVALRYAQITVSDTGKGINPNFLPYVFDRFRQESSSITRSYGGLGLGLSIVRHLVELHGGTVAADSPGEGKGATFAVKLPLL